MVRFRGRGGRIRFGSRTQEPDSVRFWRPRTGFGSGLAPRNQIRFGFSAEGPDPARFGALGPASACFWVEQATARACALPNAAAAGAGGCDMARTMGPDLTPSAVGRLKRKLTCYGSALALHTVYTCLWFNSPMRHHFQPNTLTISLTPASAPLSWCTCQSGIAHLVSTTYSSGGH